MSGLLEKDICLLLRGHRNMLILFFMICSSDWDSPAPLFWATFHL